MHLSHAMPFQRWSHRFVAIVLGVWWGSPSGHAEENSPLPNLVLIVADDLGYGETGMMGEPTIATPNIDRLAREGVRCTSGYVMSSYCSPSRAGLMTGKFPSRFGYDINPTGEKNLHPNAGLPESETTWAKVLSEQGYATGLMGKWHLGAAPHNRPEAKGFDEFRGFLHEGHYYVPTRDEASVWTMVRDTSLPAGELAFDGTSVRGHYTRMSEPDYDRNNPVVDDGEPLTTFPYLTDQIAQWTCGFMERHRRGPFAVVASFNAVHSPMQAPVQDVVSIDGSPLDANNIQRAIFAGMLRRLDAAVGEILRRVEELGLEQNTWVVFLSDNGGPTAELSSRNDPLRGGKGTLYEGGVRVPMVWKAPGMIPGGVTEDRPVWSIDVPHSFLGQVRRSTLSNNPDRSESHRQHQAMQWTGDGRDITAWLGRPEVEAESRPLYFRMTRGKAAIRIGRFKAIRDQDRRWSLFDLRDDLGESRDLAKQMPDQLASMVEHWNQMDRNMAPPLSLAPVQHAVPKRARTEPPVVSP